MQRDPYYNPMPQQNQGQWQFNPTPLDYSTQRQTAQGNIDQQQRNKEHLDRLYSMQGVMETLPQAPGFMGEMVTGGVRELGNMAGDAFDKWRRPQPDAMAKASPYGDQNVDWGSILQHFYLNR